MVALDHERCHLSPKCTLHSGWVTTTTLKERNRQIREDWASGEWTVEELSSFWELTPKYVATILIHSAGADQSRAGSPPRQIRRSS